MYIYELIYRFLHKRTCAALDHIRGESQVSMPWRYPTQQREIGREVFDAGWFVANSIPLPWSPCR